VWVGRGGGGGSAVVGRGRGRAGGEGGGGGGEGKCVTGAMGSEGAALKGVLAQVMSAWGPVPRVWNC